MRFSVTIKDKKGNKKNAANFSVNLSSEADAQMWGKKQAEAMGLEGAEIKVVKEQGV